MLAGVLTIAVAFMTLGIYWYKAKVGADTASTNSTPVQLVDSAGIVVKKAVPVKLTFNGTVRVCKRTSIVFQFTKCKTESRVYDGLTTTDANGLVNVSTALYKPFSSYTFDEKKALFQSFLADSIGVPTTDLTIDETARLDKAIAQLNDKSTSDQIEKVVTSAFQGWDGKKLSTKMTGAVIGGGVTALTTTLAAGIVGGLAFAPGKSIDALTLNANRLFGLVSNNPNWRILGSSKFEHSLTIKTVALSLQSANLSSDVLSVNLATANPSTNLVVSLNDNGATQLASAKAKFAELVKTVPNYVTLLNVFDTFYQYGLLHGYTEASTNPAILAQIKTLLDGGAGIPTTAPTTTGMSGLVVNPNFEEDGDAWVLGHFVGNTTAVDAIVSGVDCLAGKCLKMTHEGTWQRAIQATGRLAKGTYKLTAKFKTGASGGTAGLQLYGEKNGSSVGSAESLIETKGSVEWKDISSTEVVVDDKNADNDWYIYLYGDQFTPSRTNINNTNTIFYDSVVLTKTK